MLVASPALPAVPQVNRNYVIAGCVVLFHLGALWALQSGLLRRTAELVIPVAILSEIVNPPTPKIETPALPRPAPPEAAQKLAPRKPEPVLRKPAPPPASQPITEAPSSTPLQTSAPVAAAPAPIAATPMAPSPPQAPPAPPAEAAPAKVELPSSQASYLQNPPLVYPSMSKRLGEQGKVIVRVLIGADGLPQNAQLKTSSGFDRLDRAAVDYVMKCRYVPGKVGGTAQAMWHDAPVNFVLE